MGVDLAFVLLPGAGMSSWIWSRIDGMLDAPAVMVSDRLERNDYAARKGSSLGDCVAHALGEAEKANARTYVVVGHSGAGPIAAGLATALGDRAARVVYVAANLPPQGATMIDSLPAHLRLINIIALRRMIRKDSIPYAGFEKVVREKFCNDCDEETVRMVLGRDMRSEPLCAITGKMDWTGLPRGRQTYLLLTKDMTLSVERQRAMAANVGVTDFAEIAGDHMSMLGHPREFADFLNGIARGAKG